MLMKSFRHPALSHARPIARIALISFLLFLPGSSLSSAARTKTSDREMTAADMLTEQLPGKTTLQNASKSEFLGAVCAAVKKRRRAAAAIAQAAVTMRREAAGEIVGMVLRCSGKLNCEFVGVIAAAAAVAQGDATALGDAASAKAPDCAETIRESTRMAPKTAAPAARPEQTPSPGASNGLDGGFDPHEQLELVCDAGTQRALRASLVEEFLRNHPGSLRGPCQTAPRPTPSAPR